MSYLIALAFLFIVSALVAALIFMMRDGQNGSAKTNKMAWALALRVGLSIVLFICVLISWKLGYIHPTGIVVPKAGA